MHEVRRGVSAIAAASAILLVAASGASAASGTWASGGLSEVHAQGSWKTEYSKLYFSGYVADRGCDGKPAALDIAFAEQLLPKAPFITYRRERVQMSPCGYYKNFSFNTYNPNTKTAVSVRECVVGGAAFGADRCGGWSVVLTATP